MGRKSLAGCHIVTCGKWSADYSTENMKKWIEHRGGHHQVKVNGKTTHLVVTADKWRDNDKQVQDAQALIESGNKVSIVKFDWLVTIFNSSGRRSVSKFLWTDPSGKRDGQKKSPIKKNEILDELQEHVKTTANEEEIAKVVKKHDEAKKSAKMAERSGRPSVLEHREQFKHAENSDTATVFARGAKKAKDEGLSSNYHIFVDSTGFAYDVTVTKIEQQYNRNQRWAITIYESNTVPHTYAVNAIFGGTGLLPQNNMITSIGSTWDAAFRRFRGFFEAKTHVAWEDRIKFAKERDLLDAARADRRALSSKNRPKFREVNRDSPDFAKEAFHYYPPVFGPVGLIDLESTSAGMTLQAERHDSPQRSTGAANRIDKQELANPLTNELPNATVDRPQINVAGTKLSSGPKKGEVSECTVRADHGQMQAKDRAKGGTVAPAPASESVVSKKRMHSGEDDNQMRAARALKLSARVDGVCCSSNS